MTPVEPPVGLKEDISRAIRHRERVLRAFETENAKPAGSWFEGLFGNVGFRFAAALGLGAAAILLIVTIRTPAPVGTNDLMGSMAPPVAPTVDTRIIELDGVSGTIRETNGPAGSFVEIRLHADHPVRLEVLASPDAWDIATGSRTGAVREDEAGWTIDHTGSDVHRFALRSGVAAGSFRVRVASGNQISETDLGLVIAESAR